jgi:Domain of unknown function (DUF4105)
VVKFILLYCGILFFSDFGRAAEFIPPMPKDFSTTRISLLTVNDGEQLYARFGHAMIRVDDPSNGIDYLVNWGMFDFSDPLFIPKFFRGILIYRMGFGPTNGTIRYYRDVEKRGIVEDDISLTLNQKRRLLDKIIWNAQPQNLYYPYQYYRNNCATIPRDFLNLVTEGAIKKNTEDLVVPSITYRDYARTNFATNSYVSWGLDAIFNSDTDHPLTRWEEMFYPKKLREHLANLPSFDDQGRPDPSIKLLTNRHVVVDLREPVGRAIDGYYLAWIVAGIPLLVILVSLLTRLNVGKKVPLRWHNRVFGLVCLWWGLTAGFFGLTHFSGWALSLHSDLFHNLNILLFWPIDIMVLLPGVQLGIMGRDFGFKGWLGRYFWQKLSIFHLYFIPVYTLISCSGFFYQNTTRVVVYMAPLSLLYYFVMARLSGEADSVA